MTRTSSTPVTVTARPPDGANPWTRRSTEPVYANPWIRVREDKVVRPDGADGIYGVVELRNRALGAVPLFADRTTVLVGQFRYTLDAYSWEIPEGGGDPALDSRAEMARELAEETGLRAARWTPLGALHTSNCITDEVGHLWLAEDLSQGERDLDDTEVLQTWRLPFDQAVAMALDGTLTDSLTVAGLVRAAHVLDRRAR